MIHGRKIVKNLVLVGFGNIEIVSDGRTQAASLSTLVSHLNPVIHLKTISFTSLIKQIDLDTIDLSNLNRQFLFRKSDIKKSKALVAASFAQGFNPSEVKIKPRHGNIKESGNDVDWMKGFDLVLSALDNLGQYSFRHCFLLVLLAGALRSCFLALAKRPRSR